MNKAHNEDHDEKLPDGLPAHPKDIADEEIFDVLRAVRGLIHQKNCRSRSKGIDDPDNRLLRNSLFPGSY
jgi:hypothetical protein